MEDIYDHSESPLYVFYDKFFFTSFSPCKDNLL